MHEFKYKKNELHCEGVRISEISQRYGTPVYIYSQKTMIDHYQKIKRAFRGIKPLICFSVKANSNLAVLRVLARQGAGMDVVSGGELYRALKIGVSPKSIVYAGVGKNEGEIERAIKAGILFFNVESFAELELIDRLAGRRQRTVNISLRINPDISPRTHRFISTGKKLNKFGLAISKAEEIFYRGRIFPHARLIGLHLHIGSQITEPWPFVQAIKKTLPLIKRLRSKNIGLRYFNIGGGLGIIYRHEKPQTAQEFARAVMPLLKEAGLKIILEPGRFIAGNSGILVAKVVFIKKSPPKNFAIVDAGMNDLIRPALYGADHEILPVVRSTKNEMRKTKYDIVGPICESADFLAEDRAMPRLQPQDLLAVMGAGAYGFTMSSNYNSRPRAAEVLVNKNRFSLVRRRETYRDLVRQEVVDKQG